MLVILSPILIHSLIIRTKLGQEKEEGWQIWANDMEDQVFFIVD
jgi:hypothetical protein